MLRIVLVFLAGLLVGANATLSAQEIPAEYTAVVSALGKTADYKDGVLKVHLPKSVEVKPKPLEVKVT